jgi:hypothetical protein
LIKSPHGGSKRKGVGDPYREQLHDARLTLLTGFLSFLALLIYYGRHELLLYGDAVAHINIARRILDNRNWATSFWQLGTVWLPLQHVAMLPFVWNKALWQSGIAGAIPGMLAYILGTLGIFRLVSGRAPKVAAYLAAAVYALNPNLLYMQATAMNEPILLALFVWALVYLDELLRAIFPSTLESGAVPARMRPQAALEACGIVLACGVLTRYDGWFIAAALGVVVSCALAVWWRRAPQGAIRRRMTKSFVEFLLLNLLVPVFWLTYNYSLSGRALDFANGPYSAKAIALRTTASGAPPYPGQHNLLVAGVYYLKSATLNMGTGFWGYLFLTLAVLGTVVAAYGWRRYGTFLLLWLPLPFYAFSIAYGSVPVFLPVWYPYSYYNVRYGLELLPVFAIFPALLPILAAERVKSESQKKGVWVVLAVLCAASYMSCYLATPITLQEARTNSRTRISMETALANFLIRVPRSETLLMYQGEHVGALQQADISLKRVISEVAHPDWELALLDPVHSAGVIIACNGDPVWAAVRDHRGELQQLMAIDVPGQPRCAIYKPA